MAAQPLTVTARRVGSRGCGSGFTLLEVLVALAVVAVALAALARAGSQAIEAQRSLEERTLALWVADNVLAEMRLEADLSPGRRQGQARQGGRDWFWDALIQPTPGDELLRMDVAVHAERSRSAPIVSQTGFRER